MKLGIWIRLKIAILSLSFATGCVAEPHNEQKKPYKITVKDQSLFFDGRLLGSAADDLQRQLDMKTEGRIQKIIIRSAGGNADVAVKVGEIVHKNGLDVQVNHYCISGCASFVFLAATRKIISPNSVVVFHTSASATRKVLVNSGLDAARSTFEPFVNLEEQLYAKLDVDQMLRFATIPAMIPLCVNENETKPATDPTRYAVHWTYAAWMPSKELLESTGVKNIEGVWPRSREEAMKLASSFFRPDFTINYIDDEWAEIPENAAYPKCNQS